MLLKENYQVMSVTGEYANVYYVNTTTNLTLQIRVTEYLAMNPLPRYIVYA